MKLEARLHFQAAIQQFNSLSRELPESSEAEESRRYQARIPNQLRRSLFSMYNSGSTLSDLSGSVKPLADAGRKLEAVKLHMGQNGLGLQEAKDAAESYIGKRD